MLRGLARALRRWMLRVKGWRGIEEYLADGKSIDFMVVVPVVRSLEGCPGRSVLEAMARAGLYEELILLAVRGCSVPGDLLSEARMFFASAGLPKWEEAASRLLGVESLYETARSSVVYAVCTGDRASLGVGDPPRVTVEMGVSRGGRWTGTPEEAIKAFLERGRPALYVYWGEECPRPPGVPSVDGRVLVSIAYPDVPPSIAGLAYHFDSDPSCPACVLARAAEAAASLLASIGVDWGRLPPEARWASSLARGPPAPRESGDHVVVTDRPRLELPVYKPYRVEPAPADAGDPWSYAAHVALRSLAARPGDAGRAYALRRGLPLDDLLPGMILASLRPNREPPRPGQQVEPWHAGWPWVRRALEGGRVVYRCIGPPSLCLGRAPPAWEAEAAAAAGLPWPPPPASPTPGASEAPVAREDEEAGIQGPRPTGLRVHAASERVWRPCQVAGAARELAGGSGGRVLVVAPARPLASAAARCGGWRLLDDGGIDEWLVEGGWAAASWSFVLEHPEALKAADVVVALFPERMTRGSPGGAAALAAFLGGLAVSRLLARLAARGSVDAVVVGSGEVEGGGSFDVEELVEYARKVFEEHWSRTVGPGARLRPYQEAALRVILTHAAEGVAGATLVILPTGAGKSAIFQVAARVMADNGMGSAALVVSPLRALMHDQVRGAEARGFRASYIDSSVPRSEKEERLEAALGGGLDLLYVTPERFGDPLFERALRDSVPALVVLDEAHTLSRWGMSFRPGYLYMARRLASMRRERGWPPVVALTATAPGGVASDIMRSLGSQGYVEVGISLREDPRLGDVDPGKDYVLRAPPVRDELVFDVATSPAGDERLEDLARVVGELREWADSLGEPWVGVVFTGFVKSTRQPWLNAPSIARFLSARLGEEVAVYHGQLGERERRRIEEAVARAAAGGGGPRIVVATKAFGMGVDIPRIRFVVHAAPSDSLEDYYQEAGRAGRDGREAIVVTLFDGADFEFRRRLKRREAVRPSQALEVYNAVIAVASLSRDSRTALIPGSLLSAIAGGDEAAGRALEALRVAGLLEYTTIRGPARLTRGRGCLVDLRGGGCIDVGGGKGEPYRLELCRGEPPLFTAGIPGGGCRGERLAAASDGRLVLVELNPEMKHGQDTLLPPEAFVTIASMRAEELRRIDELQALLERAASARLRGGRSAANAAIRAGIEEYFSKPRRPPPDPSIAKPRRVECGPLASCLDEAVKLALKLEEELGPYGYSVAAQREDHAARLKAALEAALGRRVEDPRRVYRRLVAAQRRGPLHALMDYGYLIVLADSSSRGFQPLASRLSGYRYHALLVYTPSQARR